jgi:hypothetical protein
VAQLNALTQSAWLVTMGSVAALGGVLAIVLLWTARKGRE